MSKVNSFITFVALIAIAILVSHNVKECNKKKQSSKKEEFSSLDQWIIASFLTAECNNCSDKYKLLLAQVPINRARKSNCSISDIILEPNQFHIKSNFYPTKENLSLSLEAFNNPVDTNITHFYNTWAVPKKWMLSMEVEYFYRDLVIGYLSK